MEPDHDVDQHVAWRRERLESLAQLGGTIAALAWVAVGLGLLMAVRWQAVLGQVSSDAATRFAALAPPLLLSTVGLGVAGIGHLLRALPVICGVAEATPGTGDRPAKRSFDEFLRSMRAHRS